MRGRARDSGAQPLDQLIAQYAPVGEALAGILAGYTDEQLELIAGFTAASNQMIRQALPAAQAVTTPPAPPGLASG